MTKEDLKRLKSGLLAASLCLTLGGCSKQETEAKEKNSVETVIFFVQGKALIYEEDYNIIISHNYSAISDSILIDDNVTTFSSGIEAIRVTSMEDAVELATAIVGEENIIYIDYNDKNMQLTHSK